MALEDINEMPENIEHLLIIENTPQIFKFDKDNNYIRYKYINIDNNKDIIINIRLIDNVVYVINIYDNLNVDRYYLSSTKMIYIEKQKLKDTNDIIIEIILNYNSNEGNSKLIEISVLQIENKFFYLEKGKIKDYFISQNNNLFLYMDIGKEDEGYLKVDFLRAKGEIYGKIIQKNQNQIIDINNEVNWEPIK